MPKENIYSTPNDTKFALEYMGMIQFYTLNLHGHYVFINIIEKKEKNLNDKHNIIFFSN